MAAALAAGSHIALGITIGLLASFIQSLGLTIQRKSHVLNESLPEDQQRVEHRRPLWLLGFAIFITSNLVGSVVQIASLPVVILAPLGGISLLWNAFFARLILGDVFSPWMVVGTILIAGGAVLIGIFGIVPEQTRSLEDLLQLFSRPAFIVYFSLLGAAVLACLVITHITEYSLSRRLARNHLRAASPPALHVSENPSTLTTGVGDAITEAITTERTPLLDRKANTPEMRTINGTRLALAISYASVSGILSGMCLLFAKSGVELLLLTLRGQNQFWRWQPWALVLGLVIFALLQLWYLHKGLTLADPTLVCPSAFCFYNLSSIVNGLVYFNQFSLIPPLHLGLVLSIQSASSGDDSWTDDESGGVSDAESVVAQTSSAVPAAHEAPRLSLTRSESNVEASSSSLEQPTMGPSLWSRRRMQPRHASLGAPPPNPVAALGTGFQIGLSPVSPGFGISARERRRGSALTHSYNFGDVVDEAWHREAEEERQRRRRRRTVSEGEVGARVDALDRAEIRSLLGDEASPTR
ncbi:hypothetical protein FB45DRAFT_916960, partial [Roridomyces roridus]